ncbi:DUF3168 domain-containing protein [Jannaschia sp. KMU-145]|uniref:DUF3168 domain-containing protein n=1 Tax=Jannaschia halovivens TaxID=3388667 RepID=UPI00396AF92C
MSYALSEGLQAAIYTRLTADAELGSLVGASIYDAVPDAAPDLFVALGQENARAAGDASGQVTTHDLKVSVVTRTAGYVTAKRVAARLSDLLSNADLTLPRGRMISLRFRLARARRDEGEVTRRIDLWFRARLDDPAA